MQNGGERRAPVRALGKPLLVPDEPGRTVDAQAAPRVWTFCHSVEPSDDTAEHPTGKRKGWKRLEPQAIQTGLLLSTKWLSTPLLNVKSALGQRKVRSYLHGVEEARSPNASSYALN